MAATLLFIHIVYTHSYLRNYYIMMPTCKKSEIKHCQVCPQDHKQTTFKMLFSNGVRTDQGSPES